MAYYEVMMTRAMLQTFVRALCHRTLSLSEGVSYNEADSTFHYECVNFSAPPQGTWDLAAVHASPNEIGWHKRAEAINTELAMTCEQVASAIAGWPRLNYALDSPFEGYPSGFTASGLRCWVRFIQKPTLVVDREDQF